MALTDNTSKKESFQGIAVSGGFAVGTVFIFRPFEARVGTLLNSTDADARLGDYNAAMKKAMAELERRQADAAEQNQKDIISAHKDLINDAEITKEIQEMIEKGSQADEAIDAIYSHYSGVLSALEDPLIRERAADLDDVRLRLLRCCAGKEEQDLSNLPQNTVFIAEDITPTNVIALDRERLAALLAESGSTTTHSAILARSYKIPAVFAVEGLLSRLKDGDKVAVDAENGLIYPNPSDATIALIESKKAHYLEEQALAESFLCKKAVTADGVAIDVGLNAGEAGDWQDVDKNAVDFVGLFRTEFLYMDRPTPPNEEEQYRLYKKLLTHFSPRPVTVRTLDVGGDKKPDWLTVPDEENPFLGQRGLRLSLANEALFIKQLRAAHRAAVHDTVWLMFPMVQGLDDLAKAKALVAEAKRQLKKEGTPYAECRIGVMIEIPSLALMADKIAAEVDFASIGTNDLCQYCNAVDRNNPRMASYYQLYHPGFLQLIQQVASAFNAADKPLSVCGEMAGQPLGALTLAGLGIKKLSMGASQMPLVKYHLSKQSLDGLQRTAQNALGLPTAAAVEEALSDGFNIT